MVDYDYRNVIPHIDIDRSLGAIEYSNFEGIEDESIADFKEDTESGNDSIEMHLIKSKSYKDALILRLKKSNDSYSEAWKEFLREEQKTFGGSKMFYINGKCDKLLVLSLPNEMRNKMNMVVTRLNKINDKITRINANIKKDNLDLYTSKMKSKDSANKKKDDIINFINQSLRV